VICFDWNLVNEARFIGRFSFPQTRKPLEQDPVNILLVHIVQENRRPEKGVSTFPRPQNRTNARNLLLILNPVLLSGDGCLDNSRTIAVITGLRG